MGAVGVAAGLGRLGMAGAQDATPAAPTLPSFAGETLRIFTFAGNPFIEGPVRAHAPEFEALTGATIEITTAPFNDLFTRAQQVAQTGAGEFDVLLLANTWVADFVNLGYVAPLDDLIAADAADPLLDWADVPDGDQDEGLLGRQDLRLHRRQRQPVDVLPQGCADRSGLDGGLQDRDRQGSGSPADADRLHRGGNFLHRQGLG
jgi:hypothetical protein